MLLVFSQLRALVFLMSWDNFEHSVDEKLKLAQQLWENKSSADDSSRLISKADQVTFQVKQAWWAVTHLNSSTRSIYLALFLLSL